jgi:hypothetical protein
MDSEIKQMCQQKITTVMLVLWARLGRVAGKTDLDVIPCQRSSTIAANARVRVVQISGTGSLNVAPLRDQ